ncbi:MAG: DUF362 domain-containing protein [Dehalococcoidia bacterium]|nr:DUF362 domain-containing protein [Dehalococcoidia bacterium]
MMYEAAGFKFEAPRQVARARRVLIKPNAAYGIPYPVTTSAATIASIVQGIRSVSDADIVVLEGAVGGESIRSVFQTLGYEMPRMLGLDVKDCSYVEVENPLVKPYAIANFWLPNVILSCDYLISVTPYHILNGRPWLSVANLLGLLPRAKYGGSPGKERSSLSRQDLQQVLADLYFTLPFDLGVIDATVKYTAGADLTQGESAPLGKIFVGDPYAVDREACESAGVTADYLHYIQSAQLELEAHVQS